MLKPKEIDEIKRDVEILSPDDSERDASSSLMRIAVRHINALLTHIEEPWPDGIRKPQDVWLVCDNEVGVQYLPACPGFSDFSLSEEGANGFIKTLKSTTCRAVKYVPLHPSIEGSAE